MSLAVILTVVFWILFNYLDQMIFFYPFFSFYYPIPDFALYGFVITSIITPLLGMTISINIYALTHSSNIFNAKKVKVKFTKNSKMHDGNLKNFNKHMFAISSLFSGPFLSMFSAICVNCSSLLSVISISLLGVTGGVAFASFLSIHQTDLRALSILILLLTYYFESKKITIKTNNNLNNSCSLNKK